eukprot:TRINITY_DN11119_c0_g1_i3.p1 TRINITY_DN11119_c0_g1~~TRINITY_DN11119_c0_g1_i3.p1  ORF type:complete len:102 (-),score=2.27 TRINITY_DN11119_c0_g1_i3:1393-1698(-)
MGNKNLNAFLITNIIYINKIRFSISSLVVIAVIIIFMLLLNGFFSFIFVTSNLTTEQALFLSPFLSSPKNNPSNNIQPIYPLSHTMPNQATSSQMEHPSPA